MLAQWFRNRSRRRRASRSRPLPETLHAPDRFRSLIEIERMRADRCGGRFALAAFRFDALDDPELPIFADYLTQRIRATDCVGLLSDAQLGVILWNADEHGARRFLQRITDPDEPWTQRPSELFLYPSHQRNGHNGSSARRVALAHAGHHNHGGMEIGVNVPLDEPNGGNSVSFAVDSTETPHRPLFDFRDPHTSSPSIADQRRRPEPQAMPAEDVASATCVRERMELPRRRVSVAAEAVVDELPVCPVRPLELLFVKPTPWWKRAIDVGGAIFGLVVMSPVFLLAAAAIKLTSPGPLFFTQKRIGLGGVPFHMHKFRTMCVDAEARQAELRAFSEQDGPAFKLRNDPRITPVGRYLRRSCIDELPQLWNVLKGDMSLVGPRPLPCKEAEACDGWQRRRLEVAPGLTCLWQVQGQRRVRFAEWMRMDLAYIQRRSLLYDLKLILRTILPVVLHRASH